MTTLPHVRRAISAIAIVAVAWLFTPSTAMAADHTGAGTASTTSMVTTIKTDRTVTTSSTPTIAPDTGITASCAYTVGAYTGYYICGTDIIWFQHTNGIWEVFVVGTNRAVWHIWQRYLNDSVWTGWRSLGGVANDGVWLWNYTPTIYVLGTDNRYWCNRWGAAAWSGWFHC